MSNRIKLSLLALLLVLGVGTVWHVSRRDAPRPGRAHCTAGD